MTYILVFYLKETRKQPNKYQNKYILNILMKNGTLKVILYGIRDIQIKCFHRNVTLQNKINQKTNMELPSRTLLTSRLPTLISNYQFYKFKMLTKSLTYS